MLAGPYYTSVTPLQVQFARSASSKAKGKGKAKYVSTAKKPSLPAASIKPGGSPDRGARPSSAARPSVHSPSGVAPPTSSSSASSSLAGPSFVSAEHGVAERVAYFCEDEHLTNARLLVGAGLMLFALCTNAADIIRREPRQPKDPEAPRIEGWPAWKRYSVASFVFAAGAGMAGLSIYWPTRIIKRITVRAPAGSYLPSSDFARAGRYTTPYHSCSVDLSTRADDLFPWFFKPKRVPFDRLRLLGPLQTKPQWYYPANSSAFDETRKKGGNFAPGVPLGIAGERVSYNLRRRGAEFTDLEGLERALLENDALQAKADVTVSAGKSEATA